MERKSLRKEINREKIKERKNEKGKEANINEHPHRFHLSPLSPLFLLIQDEAKHGKLSHL